MKATWDDKNGAPISTDELAADGILNMHLPLDPTGYQPPLDELKAKSGYIEQDQIELRPETPNLTAICAKFVDEHKHEDDEVRFVLEGEGVFDIRSSGDRWMHVFVEAGDLLVVPAGRHHRFFLTDAKTIRCVRLFKDAEGWVAHYRSSAA